MTEATNNASGPVAWQLQLPDGRVTLEKAFPSWAVGGDGYTITPLYTAPPAAAVVMPEPMKRGEEGMGEYGAAMIRGYNACLREVARLNPAPDHLRGVTKMVVPEGWLKALDEAVTAIYFDDGSDFRSALLAVVRNLSPRIADELDRNETAAWHMVRDMLAAAPTPEPASLCARCLGSGFVDDGEIGCYPNGEPYEHGPVKCVKDCPVCKPEQPAQPANQYYFKKSHCPAKEASDSECVCWHSEGAGPFPSAVSGDDYGLTWRIAPSQPAKEVQ